MDELQTYLEPSKSVPLSASLSCPELTDLVIPHTSRLTGLTIQLDRPMGFGEIMHRLPHPIPALRTFCISDDHRHQLERINATFYGITLGILHDLDTPRAVTLPHVREMS